MDHPADKAREGDGDLAAWLRRELKQAHVCSRQELDQHPSPFTARQMVVLGLILLLVVIGPIAFASSLGEHYPEIERLLVASFTVIGFAFLGVAFHWRPGFRRDFWPDFLQLLEDTRHNLFEAGVLAAAMEDDEGLLLLAPHAEPGAFNLGALLLAPGAAVRPHWPKRFRERLRLFVHDYERICERLSQRTYPVMGLGSQQSLSRFGNPAIYLREAVWLALYLGLVDQEYCPPWLPDDAAARLRQQRRSGGHS